MDRQFVRNSATVGTAQIVARCLGLLFSFAVAKLYTPAAFGEVRYLMALASVLTIPTTALPHMFSRFISRARAAGQDEVDRYFSNSLVLLASTTGVVFVATIVACVVLHHVYVGLFALCIGLVVVAIYFDLLRAVERFYALAGFYITANVVQLVVVIAAAMVHVFSVTLVLVAYGLSCLPPLLYIELRGRSPLHFRVRSISRPLLREVTLFSVPMLLAHAAYTAWFGIDVLLVQHFLGYTAVGNYALSKTVTLVFVFVPYATTTVVLPRFVHAQSRNGSAYLQATLLTSVAASSALLVLLALGGTPLLHLVFHHKYPTADLTLVPLSIGMALYSVYIVLETWVVSIGKPILHAFSMSLTMIGALGSDVILIPRLGQQGAGIGFAFGTALGLASLTLLTSGTWLEKRSAARRAATSTAIQPYRRRAFNPTPVAWPIWIGEVRTMELWQYAMVVRRYIHVVVISVVVATLAGIAVTSSEKVIYTATVQLVAQQFVTSGSAYQQDVYGSQLLAYNDAAMATAYPVLQAAASDPGISDGASGLAMRVTAAALPNSAVFKIQATASSSDLAVRSANAVAQAFVTRTIEAQENHFQQARGKLSGDLAAAAARIDTLQRRINALALQRTSVKQLAQLTALESEQAQARGLYNTIQNTLQQTITTQAQLGATVLITQPARPSNVTVTRPNRRVLVALAALGGAILGLALTFLLHYVSDILNTADSVTRGSGLPVLGHVAAFRRQEDDVVVSLVQPRSAAAEGYRLLSASLRPAQKGAYPHAKTIVVTSPLQGDGKTTTVANLAVALAQAGQSVIAVDANVLRPCLHSLLAGVGDKSGVLDALHNGGVAHDSRYLQLTMVEGLRLLAAGSPSDDAAVLVASPRMKELLSDLRAYADVVLIDSPALSEAADAALLAGCADDTLIVVDAGRTTARNLAAAESLLNRTGATIRGVLLNKMAGGYDA